MRKTDDKKMDVAEMRVLRWMSGVTREDRNRNGYIRGSTKVVEKSKKIQEGRLRWYGHLLRREEHHVGRHAMEMEERGKTKEERPRKRWRDCVDCRGRDENSSDSTKDDGVKTKPYTRASNSVFWN
ncbi:uncharacterized protein LOC135217627 [Macrobrachium nipponense]|uniref:uncharacterized protein LOC135217627 n=1 Tax=Macrobrachium nipponense TaxID=159736 RepID=UPI0030C7C30D